MRKQPLHPSTAAINEKQKNLSKKSRIDALRWLARRFPEAFDNSKHIRPLQLGIMQQILSYADEALHEGISKSKLREAVVLFTRRIDYLVCLKAREQRIDLFGNKGELVTEEDAERAAVKIRQRVDRSIKNLKKDSPSTINLPKAKKTLKVNATEESLYPKYLSEQPIAYNMQNSFSHSSRTQQVTIKHKQSRQYDPEAVARLKEKLGLSRGKKEEI